MSWGGAIDIFGLPLICAHGVRVELKLPRSPTSRTPRTYMTGLTYTPVDPLIVMILGLLYHDSLLLL